MMTADPRATMRARVSRIVVVGTVLGLLGGAGLAVVATASAASAADDTKCSREVRNDNRATPSALGRLDYKQAWKLATGKGIIVAVVDSGVDVRNAHLGDAVLPGTDIVAPDGGADGRTDSVGHGTAVAGEIAARIVPGSGVVGLAKDAQILPVQVYDTLAEHAEDAAPGADSAAAGTKLNNGAIAAGIRYAAAHGAVVINVSLSSPIDDWDLQSAVIDATAGGALVVASAGNRGTATDTTDSPRYPAAYDEVLSVTAVDDQNKGTASSIHGAHVGVAAPGTNVLTSWYDKGDCMLAPTVEGASSSWATAYASAAAALVAQRFPHETPKQWKYRLEVTASRPLLEERDDLVGWGVIRPYEALSFVDDGTAYGLDSPVFIGQGSMNGGVPPVTVGVRRDPLVRAQGIGSWWVLGGATALFGIMLVSQLKSRRRRS